MKARLERCWASEGYELTLIMQGPAQDQFSIALLGEIEWKAFPIHAYVSRDEVKADWRFHPDALRMFFESLREEMIRLGLIPRPLVEDEVKELRLQLEDVKKTRDRLLNTVDGAIAAFGREVPDEARK